MAQSPDKRARLVAATGKLTASRGFNLTSLADIASASGVPLGNVYYYFKTKDALGKAMIDARADAFRSARAVWDEEPDPRQRLIAFVDSIVANRKELAKSGCPIGSLCAELGKAPGPLARQTTKLLGELLGWLKEQFRSLGKGAASGDFARHLLAAIQGACLLAQAFHSPEPVVREANLLKAWLRDV